MADIDNKNEEIYEDIYTLTDENGEEMDFRLLGKYVENDKMYYALIQIDAEGNEMSDEYVILEYAVDENGEDVLQTIDDDDEFDRVAEYFEDQLNEIDYDAEG